jgi:hypothetical protein
MEPSPPTREGSVKSPFVAVLAIATALAAPAAASAATLSVDPAAPCYREQSKVFLNGEGFTANAGVAFSRDGRSLGSAILADASGQINAQLTLPDLFSGQQRLTYVATDTTNSSITSQIGLLVSATDVGVKPGHGAPNRVLTISARGFIGGGTTLWAHIVKRGKKQARTARIGRVRGNCKTLKAKKRLFAAGAPAGVYHVQFDTFRSYKKSRAVKVEFSVTVFKTTRPSAAAASTGWRRVG